MSPGAAATSPSMSPSVPPAAGSHLLEVGEGQRAAPGRAVRVLQADELGAGMVPAAVGLTDGQLQLLQVQRAVGQVLQRLGVHPSHLRPGSGAGGERPCPPRPLRPCLQHQPRAAARAVPSRAGPEPSVRPRQPEEGSSKPPCPMEPCWGRSPAPTCATPPCS